MSHWAEIDESNMVLRVVVGDERDSVAMSEWLTIHLGGCWLQTSYNTHAGVHLNGGTPFRGNYAGIGFTYDETLDAFIPPKPEPTDEIADWVLDEETFSWVEA
jgi:hypothetical protein